MNEVPNRQKGKIMERNYEEIFQKVMDYEQALHEKNRKRIKIGLKCIWIVPLFFLALLFLTGSNKVIFLILWIVSLFALSIYLIVVEYMDYNLQEKIMELKGEEGDLKAVTPTDFDRAAQIIRETRKLIGEGLNSPAETGTEEDPEDETEEENEDETEDWEDGGSVIMWWRSLLSWDSASSRHCMPGSTFSPTGILTSPQLPVS